MNNVQHLRALETMKAATRSTLRRNAVGVALGFLWSQGVETQRWLKGTINGKTYRRRTGENLGTSGGALGGAALGAAVGTTLLPGIGTTVGALLGGMLGARSGRALARRLTG